MGLLKAIRNNEVDKKSKNSMKGEHMELVSIELNNFRNVEHAIYNLTHVNVVEAKNHKGKTNTITAVNWVPTGKMLDGSADDISLKPIGNSREKVSVKLTLESDDGRTHTIERTYQEKWVKTRGGEFETLEGHETKYIIDDIVQKKNTEALEEIQAIMGVDETTFNKIKAIDPCLALMNPTYLEETIDWKVLRQLIISIIGDVENDEVFKSASETIIAKDLLEQYGYNVEKVVTYCRQQITGATQKIEELNAQIAVLQTTQDLTPEELEKVRKEIEEKQHAIALIREEGQAENPEILLLKKELESTKKEFEELKQKEKAAYLENIDAAIQTKNTILTDRDEKKTAMDKAVATCNEIKYAIQSDESKLANLEKRITELNSNKDKMLLTYYKLTKETYTPGESKTCPNCGHVLNQEELDAQAKKWQEEHDAAVANNVAEGKKLKLEIDSQIKEKLELKESIQALNNSYADALNEKDRLTEIFNKVTEEYKEFIATMPTIGKFEQSDKCWEINTKVLQLEQKIVELEFQPNPGASERSEQISKLNAEIEILKEHEGQHYVYLEYQKKVEELMATRKNVAKTKIHLEQVKEAATLFNKTKLDILDQRLVSHFGTEVRWVLVEKNIKEGSWDNTCYPLIIGTNTPFKNGSTSEKVMTGVKIIELLKKELNAPDLPLLIDEIGELDSESLMELKAITQAQIIATRVNDNYDAPTIKNL